MRHIQVTRTVWGITGLFVVAAIAFAAGGPSEAQDGAALYEARCAQCHGAEDVAAWADAHPDPEARAAWLAEVLAEHNRPPEEQRAAIIQHIQEEIGATMPDG